MKQNDIESLSPFERHYRARQSLIRSTLMRILIAVGLAVITVACRLRGLSLGIMIFAIVTDLALVVPAWKVMKEQDKLMDELDGGNEDVTAEH